MFSCIFFVHLLSRLYIFYASFQYFHKNTKIRIFMPIDECHKSFGKLMFPLRFRVAESVKINFATRIKIRVSRLFVYALIRERLAVELWRGR